MKKLILTDIKKKKEFNVNYLSFFSKCSKSNIFKKDDVVLKNVILKKKNEFLYLKNINNKIFKILKKQLNKEFEIKKNDIYWMILIYPWICSYTAFSYSKWKVAKFLKIKDKKFKVEDFVSENLIVNEDHLNFNRNCCDDYYNFYFLKKIFRFIGLKNVIFIKRKPINEYDSKKKKNFINIKLISIYVKNFIYKILFSYFIKNSKIYFDNFLFPRKKFYILCFKLKIFPLLNHNFILPRKLHNKNIYDVKLRDKLKNYLTKFKNKDFFFRFVLSDISSSIPMSYLENYTKNRSLIKNFSKIKKNIITGSSLFYDDIFKTYLAETINNGSKLIFTDHGIQTHKFGRFLGYENFISDKLILWNKRLKSNKIFYLPPSLPIIGKEINLNAKKKVNCTIVFFEAHKYVFNVQSVPSLYNSIFQFSDIIKMVKTFDKNIRNVVKFRNKNHSSFHATQRFERIFGKNMIANHSYSFFKTLENSKLIIATYPSTAFFESIFSNTPTILILFKDHWIFEKKLEKYLNLFLKMNMAFYNIKDAVNFVNKNWNKLSDWWDSANVQKSRKAFIFGYSNYKDDYLSIYENFFKKLKN